MTQVVIRILGLLLTVLVTGCNEQTSAEPQNMSYKTKAENASIRVEREHRLSENESVRVVIVPGFPYGERCVLYTGPTSGSMDCKEIMPPEQ